MSQLFGFLSNDDTLNALVMAEVGPQLEAITSGERAGLGLGWIQNGRSLLRKHPPKRAQMADIPSLVADIPSRTIVGHVRHASLGTGTAHDLQPFRYRDWLYAQRGLTEGLEDLGSALRAEIPDHIRRNIQGKSNAELIFHLFYARHEANFVAGPAHLAAAHYAATLASTMLDLEERISAEQGREAAPFLAIAATNKLLVAARIGEPLHYRFIEGLEQPAEKPLFAGHRPRPVHHAHFRALLVANKVKDPTGWQELPDRHILWVEPGWTLGTAAMDEIS